jgi:signal transduction histidine kinase
MGERDHSLLADQVWRQALEKYAAVARLSVVLYDINTHTVGSPISPNTLHALFQEYGYEPGVFSACARQCLARNSSTRTDVVIEQLLGLAVVGAPLILEGDIVGAAVAGYALVDLCQSSTIELLARRAKVPFRRLWTLAQQTRPISQHRLVLHGDLLQMLGNTVLEQVARTRQLQELAADLERRVNDRTLDLASANKSLEHELRERERAELRVRQLLARLVVVQEEERRRIARDVHDNLRQQLVALTLKLEVLQTQAVETIAWQSELQKLQELASLLDRDLVSLTRDLRPLLLEEFGLVRALRNFVGDWSRFHGVQADFHDFGTDDLQLSRDVETNLFRVVQESLNNVFKHARATNVEVTLQAHDTRVVLTVEDDGVGFDRTAIVDKDVGSGAGLIGMRERVWLIDGQLEIETTPGHGTTVIVTLPSHSAA